MVYFVNQPQSRSALLGEALGRGAGSGLSSVADKMLEQKFSQLAKTNERKQFMNDVNQSGFFKDYPEIPKLLQVLDPKDRGKFLTQFLSGQQELGASNPAQGTGAEQFAPGQQQKPSASQILAQGGKTPEIKSREAENIKKRDFQIQQSLQPVIAEYGKQFESSREAASVAQQMLDILEEKGNKFPGAIVGNLPDQLRSVVVRDPDVRNYESLSNELVTLLSQTRKGNPTTYKTKLEQASKATIGQPIESQKKILKRIIDKEEKESSLQGFIDSLRDKEGNYPKDLKARVLKEENVNDYPLKYPEEYEEGTIIEDRGKQYILKNGKWKTI